MTEETGMAEAATHSDFCPHHLSEKKRALPRIASLFEARVRDRRLQKTFDQNQVFRRYQILVPRNRPVGHNFL
jgi:hypothetical protein